jgi:sec-independent protein translocase protein TatC
MADEKKLTLLEHLLELRKRITYIAIALVVTIGVSFIFANQLFEILKRPAGDIQFYYIDVTENIGVYMQVCLTAGLILASPFIIYQLVMYVSPGLNDKEKRFVYLVIPWVGLMFIGGVVFGYLVFMPSALDFLLGFGNNIALPQIRIQNYISVVTKFLLAAGLIFELPVFLALLARLGIVSSQWLAKKRKWAIILAFVLAALITPTPDPVNQIIVAVPLYVLYEFSIWLAWLIQKRKAKAAAESEST